MSYGSAAGLTATTYTVNISGGTPTPSTVSINAGDTVHFVNGDSVAYLIKLFTSPGSGSAKHIDVCAVIYTGTNNTIDFMATPGLTGGNGRCTYDVLNLDGTPPSPILTGGNNVIIIGSGS